jgi:nucleoside-diphosphate-sugar epimerase
MVKTALVTGASGFIGRHFTRYLRETLGYEVTGIDLVESSGVITLDANHLFRPELQVDARYDLVVHAAYHVGGRATIDGNPSVLALNLALDAGMFEWAVRTGQRHVLYFSSSAVYPVELQTGKLVEGDWFLLNEKHACTHLPLLPDARYGWAKLTGEKLAQAAREQGLDVTVVRPFSGYGPDQSLDYPFPSLIRRVWDRENPVEVWGSGNQVRDWIHVSDVVRGAMAAVEEDDVHTTNLGTGYGASMREVIEIAMRITGYNAPIVPLRDKPEGVMERVCDPAYMHTFYTPRVPLEAGIRETVDYLKA